MFGQSSTIVGYESDGAIFQWVNDRAVPTGADGTPTNFEIVAYAPAHSEYQNYPWFTDVNERGWAGAATFGSMQLPSGAQVINMATVDWADGLFTGKLAPTDRDTIADEQVGRITYNAFRQLGHLPGTPSIKGQPVYQAGQDFGVFVWKDFFDGPYHLVTNGKGSAEHLTVTVIASGEITDASSWNLAGGDSFEAQSNSLQLDSHLSSAAEGVDFSIAPGEFVTLGVQRQGGDGPFDIKLGAHRDPGVPRGWTISTNAIPHPLPLFTGGEDLGVFFGQDTVSPSEPLQFRWSSNGRATPGSIQVLAAEASMTASAGQLESEDQLLVRPHMVDAHGNVAGTDIDGFDISFEETPSRLAVLANMDGMFESRLVNDGQLGRPDTVLLPQVTPRGQPVYDPGQDAALRVWLDDAGVWHVRGSAGGGSQQYQGTIISTQPLQNLASTGLQPNDAVTLLDPYHVQFSITMSDSGEAGFSFETPVDTALSLDLDGGSAPLRVGGESWPVLSLPVEISG